MHFKNTLQSPISKSETLVKLSSFFADKCVVNVSDEKSLQRLIQANDFRRKGSESTNKEKVLVLTYPGIEMEY